MQTKLNQHFRRWAGKTALFTASALFGVAAYAQNAIENITGFVQGGTEVVRVELTEPLTALPAGFVVQSPPRIALDLPGVSSKVSRQLQEFNRGNLRSAQVVQGNGRSRVVINLKQSTTYRADISGNSLLVTLNPAPLSAPAKATQQVFAESRNTSVLPLRGIDFRRGADNSGRIVVQLPNSQVGVDIKPQGQNLVVDLLKSSLPPSLNKRFDVTDFGTPVQRVTAAQSGDRVRLTIAARGEWEHSAYQSDDQLVVELHPLRVDPNKLTQGPGYRGEKLSLNFQNVEIRALLQVIADFTNFNIITSDSVNGNLTLRLKDVPWDQALDVVLQAKGLGMRKNGNVIWIAPKDEMAAKEKQELEARAAVTGLEPLRTQSYQLNYAKAVDILKGLEGEGSKNTKMLSSRGSAIAESRTNMLFVTDVPAVLEQISAMIAKLDVPVRQVMIEARMVEAADTWGQSLGVRLGINSGGQQRGAHLGTSKGDSVRLGIGETESALASTLYNFAAPKLSSGDVNPAALAISIFSSGAARFLNLEISALEADGNGKVISSPRVVTADQTKAIIEQGVNLPYLVASSSGATAVQFQKASLKLEVTPQITPEGSVIMDVDITNDQVDRPTVAGYAISTKHIQTNVLVENGGTVVIGGIYTVNETNNVSKVPLLGDIPVVGNLFKTRKKESSKREMLVFLTPKIVSERAAIR
ncbi:MAG: type IV pilus secretin PilQ [Brachymonas sp.]|nr:type IV pilus secretin PilQ [Brachymonas sp.]